MATSGATKELDESLAKVYKLARYLSPKSSSDVFHLDSVTPENARLLYLLLENTRVSKLNITCQDISPEHALGLFFHAFNNDKITFKKLFLGSHIQACENDSPAADEEFVLEKLKVDYESSLVVNLDSMPAEDAEQLAQILSKPFFQKIELKVKNISVESTLSILRAIGGNPQVQKINIIIPNYHVDNLQALRAFLEKPHSEQAPRPVVASAEQEKELNDAFSKLLVGAKEDYQEVKAVAHNVLQTGRTFFTGWVGPVASSVTSLLFEEDPDPVAAAAHEQRPEEGRGSPKNASL